MPTATDIAAWFLGQGGAAALVLARASGLAATAPAWGTPGMGWRLRLALAALLAAALAPVVGPGLGVPAGGVALGWAMLVELAVGGALGMSAALVVAGARQAGEVVGGQCGLSAAALFDPEAGEGMTALGHLYGLVALGTFLALDGPLRLAGALVESYRVIPAGGLALSPELAGQAFGRVGQALDLAVRAAAPAALALAAAGIALGLLGRAAPALQLLSLALPIRAAVGLVLALLGLATLVATLATAWGGWFGPDGLALP
jgi:flagellar biosynthesis protein FliR